MRTITDSTAEELLTALQGCIYYNCLLYTSMESFMNMRRAEGARMKEDVLGRSKTILSIVEQIDEQSPQTVRCV